MLSSTGVDKNEENQRIGSMHVLLFSREKRFST